MQRNLVIRGNSTQKVLCGRDHMVDSFVSLFDPLSTAIFFFLRRIDSAITSYKS